MIPNYFTSHYPVWNLYVNLSKTEKPLMKRGTNESIWRKTKQFGSLIGEEQDLTRRKSLANAAFFKLSKTKRKEKVTSIQRHDFIDLAIQWKFLGYVQTQWTKIDAFH